MQLQGYQSSFKRERLGNGSLDNPQKAALFAWGAGEDVKVVVVGGSADNPSINFVRDLSFMKVKSFWVGYPTTIDAGEVLDLGASHGNGNRQGGSRNDYAR